MINEFLTCVVNELGATGLLVVGLYWILYKPLREITTHIHTINGELGEIRDILKDGLRRLNGKN